MYLKKFVVFILFVFFIGCASPNLNTPANLEGYNDKAFRGRWWNYYDRSLYLTDNGYLQEAIQDLKEAINQRKDDQRRARTYGMHFVDYFPHRELGVIFFKQGKIEEAIQEINISLSTEKSSKAFYYLDLARKKLLTTNQLDKNPPEIAVNAIQKTVDGKLITISGIVKDDALVKSILVDDKEVRIDLSNKEVPFTIDVPIKAGSNSIKIVAQDLSGKETIKNVNILDNQANMTIKSDMSIKEMGSRLCLAVGPFERKIIGKDKQLSINTEDLLQDSIIKRKRFSIVDRKQKGMQAILEELKMSQTGLIDEKKALEMGKMKAADCMLFGSTLERVNSLEIYIRLVDTETTEIITAVDAYAENIDKNMLNKLTQNLDFKLTDEMPILEGLIAQNQGNSIVINIGKDKKIKTGMKLIIYEKKDVVIDPATGEALGAGIEEVAQARVKDILDKMSYIELTKSHSQEIKVKQIVITR